MFEVCGHDAPGDPCPRRATARYLTGPRCAAHTPAAAAGRPEPPTPPPPPPAPRRPPYPYGHATDDPLGRTIPGTARNGMIPKRKDPTP